MNEVRAPNALDVRYAEDATALAVAIRAHNLDGLGGRGVAILYALASYAGQPLHAETVGRAVGVTEWSARKALERLEHAHGLGGTLVERAGGALWRLGPDLFHIARGYLGRPVTEAPT